MTQIIFRAEQCCSLFFIEVMLKKNNNSYILKHKRKAAKKKFPPSETFLRRLFVLSFDKLVQTNMSPLLCQHFSHVFFGKDYSSFSISFWFHIRAICDFWLFKGDRAVLLWMGTILVLHFSFFFVGQPAGWHRGGMTLPPTHTGLPFGSRIFRLSTVWCVYVRACVCFVRQSGEQRGSVVAAGAWPIPTYCLCVMSTHHVCKR